MGLAEFPCRQPGRPDWEKIDHMGPSGTPTTLVALLAAVLLPVLALRFGDGLRPARKGASTKGAAVPDATASDATASEATEPVAAERASRRRPKRWKRIRFAMPGSPTLRIRLARLGLVIGCQLSGVMFVGIVANDYGDFYSSWSEIFGLSSTTPLTAPSHHFGAASPAGGVVTPTGAPHYPGDPQIPAAAATWKTTSWSSQDQWLTRGAIVETKVGGGPTKLSENVLVYLPPAYFRTGDAARRLPVLEVLTGYPGTASHLVSNLKYPDRLLSAIQTGAARDMVMVMMQPAPTFPWDTECSNVPGGPQALSFFTNDVPASVSQLFALNPTGYGAIGDSTGGYCAAKMAITDPSRFGGAAMLSGYYSPATDRTTQGIFGSTNLRNQNNLVWLLTHRPMPKTAILACTSRTEGGNDGYAANQQLLAAVKTPMSADELLLPSGGHNFQAWGREIPYALSWLSAHLYAQANPPQPVNP
jgi:S-formylglutathione hydrolase FrmB